MIAGKTSHTRHKPKLVQGIGINDVNYPVQIYESVNGVNRRVWICPVYRVWVNMLKRCYGSNDTDYYFSYHGCTVTLEWHVFSQFRAWVVRQDYEAKELDKDILFPGNKVYSPQIMVRHVENYL